jgi:putative pyrroloquinoline-quinone binding quinoprotein
MTIIELGDVTPGSEQEEPADLPRGHDRRLIRRAGVALIAAACLITMAASAPPEPSHALRTLWNVRFGAADRYAVTPDTVYTSRQETLGQLEARDLATGALRWAVDMPDPTAWPTFVPSAGVLLVPYGRAAKEVKAPDGGTYFNEIYRNTMALDARTGTELWRRPGAIYLATDDGVLLSDPDIDGDQITALRFVRIRDGSLVWARPDLHVQRVTAGGAEPGRPDLLVTVAPAGAVQILRLADGYRMSAGRVIWTAGSPGDGTYTDVFVDGARVYVRVTGQQSSAMTAYAIDTFRRLWRINGTDADAAYPCGVLICGLDQSGFAAYDPATGAIRWRSTDIRNAWPASSGRLVADSGRLVADSVDHWTLIDEATGHMVADLGSGAPVPDLDGRVSYLVRATKSPRGLTAVSRIDSDSGTVGVRGAIDWVSDGSCLASGNHLVCATVAGQLIVMLVG